MKYVLAIAALLAATSALADERIHQTPPVSIECKGQLPTGICVRGPTWYRLQGNGVRWIFDHSSPIENPDFWNDREKWGGGTNDTVTGSGQ